MNFRRCQWRRLGRCQRPAVQHSHPWACCRARSRRRRPSGRLRARPRMSHTCAPGGTLELGSMGARGGRDLTSPCPSVDQSAASVSHAFGDGGGSHRVVFVAMVSFTFFHSVHIADIIFSVNTNARVPAYHWEHIKWVRFRPLWHMCCVWSRSPSRRRGAISGPLLSPLRLSSQNCASGCPSVEHARGKGIHRACTSR